MRFASCLLVLLAAVAVCADESDLITNLPGAPPVNFKQYAGYITVDEAHGRNMFYWFTEAQQNPEKAPLVLWLNGGPGCSSLNGLLGENGPLLVNKDGQTLSVNPHSWNQVANMLYLESPSGVGFSYSNTPSDYTTGDARTAHDGVVFLQQFLLKYPQYQGREFWITGESYGGHYVPNLASAILDANKAGGSPNINIQGFQVGNAWTVPAADNLGAAFMWWSHAFISDDTYNAMVNNCDFANIGPLSVGTFGLSGDPQVCQNAVSESSTVMSRVNIYDLYTDICTSSATNTTSAMQKTARKFFGRSVAKHQGRQLMQLLAQARAGTIFDNARSPKLGDEYPDPDPCLGEHMFAYLNQPAVQAAIHANISYPWVGCSAIVNYSNVDLLTSMIPVYQKLLASPTKLRMLVFSGDVDGIVPVTGTRNWLPLLNLPVVQKWAPWLDGATQTGGYVVKYDGLTFATVRDAGHMVPWTQPSRSFDLFSRFLKGPL